MTEKEKSLYQNQNPRKDKFWNIFCLLIGAGLAFGLNSLHNHIQCKKEIETTLTLLYNDVEYQVKYCKSLVKGFKNLKSGQFPNIARKAPTLDRSLSKVGRRIGMSIPSHKSPVSEQIASKISLLPKSIMTDVLRYYSNIFYCQSLQNNCKEALVQREGKDSNNLAPICDIYLNVLQSCIKLGEELKLKIASI